MDKRASGAQGLEPQTLRFYRSRSQWSLGILVFVAAVGLPVIGIPRLRERLVLRVELLRRAVTGDTQQLARVEVGRSREPFPIEYQHPFVPPRQEKPIAPAVLSRQPAITITIPGVASNRGPSRKLNIPSPGSAPASAVSESPASEQSGGETQEAMDDQPHYGQGAGEKEAYDLLIKSNLTLAGMVGGTNPALRLKAWDAAKRGEATYWVRVIFARSPASLDEEYIWQVKLQSKEIVPLSFNARSLPKS